MLPLNGIAPPCARWKTLYELAEPDAYAEAEQEIAAAYDAMLATVPQTIPGCMALLDHMIDDVGADVEEALSVLREALDGVAAQAV